MAHVPGLKAVLLVYLIAEFVKPCGVETGLVITEKHNHHVQQIVALPITVEITLVMVEKIVVHVHLTVELVTHHHVEMVPVVLENGVETVALTVERVPLVEMAAVTDLNLVVIV
jgi:hypothetical protein